MNNDYSDSDSVKVLTAGQLKKLIIDALVESKSLFKENSIPNYATIINGEDVIKNSAIFPVSTRGLEGTVTTKPDIRPISKTGKSLHSNKRHS